MAHRPMRERSWGDRTLEVLHGVQSGVEKGVQGALALKGIYEGGRALVSVARPALSAAAMLL